MNAPQNEWNKPDPIQPAQTKTIFKTKSGKIRSGLFTAEIPNSPLKFKEIALRKPTTKINLPLWTEFSTVTPVSHCPSWGNNDLSDFLYFDLHHS